MRGIQLSCKMKGRQMWFPVGVAILTSCTTLSDGLTSPNSTSVICRMLIGAFPPSGVVRLMR